jgi:hypothetical protein
LRIPATSDGKKDSSSTPFRSPQPPVAPDLSEVDAVLKLHQLYARAAERYAQIDSYIVRLRRREQINGKDNPEEILLLKFRKNPWSVYFKWLGAEAKGREVVYVRGQHENKIHMILAAGDMPLISAGKRIAMDPDNVLVRSSSRRSIHEAGIGVLIDRFGNHVAATEKDDRHRGPLKYLGLQSRPEFNEPCETVAETIPPGAEPQLPGGGSRLWLFDPNTRLPALIITEDATGHEVEYYCYDRFQFPVRLDEDDFNPDKLWAKKR